MVVDEACHIMVENASQYLDAKRPAYMPKLDWWTVLLCLDSVATVLSLTVSRSQGLSTLLLQQEAELKQLCALLSEMCKIDSPFLAEQVMMIDMVTALSQGLYAVAFVKLCGETGDNASMELWLLFEPLIVMTAKRFAILHVIAAVLSGGMVSHISIMNVPLSWMKVVALLQFTQTSCAK